MPSVEDYGLPRNFSIYSYKTAKDRIRSKQIRVASIGTALVALVALVILCMNYSIKDGVERELLAGFPCLLLFYKVPDYLTKWLVKSDAWELDFATEAEAYSQAVGEWRFTQTESGQGYWNALRGVAFEQAVARFFVRRGCIASLTNTTGDGGVDVILEIGKQTYWAQCKGQAKPVPVAEIRRIAGATLKSKGVARAVMFATNGYTKPALEEADELGVICMDAAKLCALASRSALSEL